jgi:23S rRNA (guanosine2251-2'-O)-methyltransferase
VAGAERVYGWHAVRALLLRGATRVQRVWLAQDRRDARAEEIERLAREAKRPIERIPAARLEQMAGEVAHQGVMAEIEPLPPWREDDLYAALRDHAAPLLLALDGVQDPHNLGACLRSADACGVVALIVPRDRAARAHRW